MDCYDPKWEYNAPTFVDFESTQLHDDSVDKWFDIDHENEVPFNMEKGGICEGNTPKVNTPRSARKSRGSQAVNSCGKETKAKLLEPCKSKDTNVMVELSEVNVVKKEKHNGHLKPLRVTRSLSARNAEATAEENVQPPVAHLKRSASMRLPRSATPQNRSRIPTPTKSSKQPVAAGKAKPSTPQAGRGKDLEAQPTAGKQPLRRANSLISRSTRQSRLMCKPSEVATSAGKKKVDAQQRSVRGRSLDVVGSSGSTSRKRTASVSSAKMASPVRAKMPKLTIANAPSFMRRLAAKPVKTAGSKSTLELEMEQAAQLRRELARHRKQAADSLRMVKTSSGPAPVRAHVAATKPIDFQFKTDGRVKPAKVDAAKVDPVGPFDFAHALRSGGHRSGDADDGSVGKQVEKGITVVKPFNLHAPNKRKRSEGTLAKCKPNPKGLSFQPMAELITKFHNSTPDRFHTMSKSAAAHAQEAARRSPRLHHLTKLKTPHLLSRTRSRPVTVPSQQELEEKKVEEMRSHQFKATKLNPKMFQSSVMGIKKVPRKEVTEPVGFDLETERRMQAWESKKVEEAGAYEFHANPVPVAILHGTVGIGPPPKVKLTVPESPAFATRSRSQLHQSKMEEKVPKQNTSRIMRAHPIPHTGIPFLPNYDHKTTVPEPFSFAARDVEKEKLKEEKIKSIIEGESKQVPEFRAQPLPSSAKKGIPEVKPRDVTRFEPFKLHTEERGTRSAETWSAKMAEEIEKQREQALFHASSNRVVHEAPFVPQRSNKPLTEILDIALNTEKRFESRQAYEDWLHQKELAKAQAERANQMQKEEEERKTIARMRNEIVHHAQPVRKYTPLELKLSDQPLTEAQSPAFSKRPRRSARL
ncbi:PREDICTED: targeting protein for Xklp2 homolog isoform X3 [Priapulus caudatus]|uniref:Targeting protein for Xklp2 homolog isoform X1 n=1 Tax=Priapulus caudatus TaxID=37621 RepID=A0ABM1EFF9_PRICU|nr:PREDICTED: targeting protein for Xklp2 homolog isoform X1 [Priapulus caudatus]XP_014670931.1 PREDICTED: targeting protein for Xklp2 homolog isoform X2 [Priapulus caudatus]XP_014670932.1 PREDICTED: targeting protein for Xklp2 homolog isoform X3 [Priapulus caudatus]